MRTLFNTLLIIFVLFSMYVVRDDLSSAYQKAKKYVGTHSMQDILKGNFFAKDDNTSDVDLDSQTDADMIKKETKVVSVPKESKTSTPGPLRVSDKVLTLDFNNTVLTKDAVIKWTNRHRADAELPPLKENVYLDSSASIKVDDMLLKQYFEHVSPTGVGVSDLGDRVGYEYILIGENLALGGFKDDESLLIAWMNSPGHRANILNTHYTEIGVSVKKGVYEGNNVWVAVQHFGLPRSACPKIDPVLKADVDLSQSNAKKIEADLKDRKAKIESGAVYEGKTHDEQIEEYNEIVAKYNALIQQIKSKVTAYNNQVRAFNECLNAATAGH